MRRRIFEGFLFGTPSESKKGKRDGRWEIGGECTLKLHRERMNSFVILLVIIIRVHLLENGTRHDLAHIIFFLLRFRTYEHYTKVGLEM